MSVAPRLNLSTRQRLALTPAMRQQLTLLRLPAQDLAGELARIADENPFLHYAPPAGAGVDTSDISAPPASFYIDLARQIAGHRLTDALRQAALVLIAELTETGYLDATLDEIAADTGLDHATLAEALVLLQGCDPPGIAARDLPECLALQLVAHGTPEPLARAIAARLDDFADQRWAALADLGLPRAELQRLAGLLVTLPAHPVACEDEAAVVTRLPDLLIEPAADGSILARINPAVTPGARAEPRFDGGSAAARNAWSEAGQIVQALAMRNATLLAIGRFLIDAHPRYFATGGQAPIQPLTRAEAAAGLGVHASTLGRAVAGKALAFAGQVIPLETFFSRALAGPEGPVSSHEVQRRIRALIAAEPETAPLADDEICRQLQSEGVDIARRTVAKYRKCMRIASSFARRRRKPPRPRTGMAPSMDPPAR